LVICLIGPNAGFPKDQSERKKVLNLTKDRLEKSFGREPKSLGDLWNEWEGKDQGMTYTQMEFFVASVFNEDTRVRLLYDQRLLKRRKDSANELSEYQNFLSDKRHSLDLIKSKNLVSDSIQISIEFALQQRDSEPGDTSQVSARDSITRGLIVLQDLNNRYQLNIPRYRNFYSRCVWPKLNHSIITWTERSEQLKIRYKDPQLQLFVSNQKTGEACILSWIHPSCEMWVFAQDLSLKTKYTIDQVYPSEVICSFTPDGKWLLTYCKKNWYMVREEGRIISRWQPPKESERPNSFNKYPEIEILDSKPTVVIPQGDGFLTYDTQGNPTQGVPAHAKSSSTRLIIPKTGMISLKSEKTLINSITIFERAYPITDDGLIFYQKDNSSFELRRYISEPALNIYLVEEREIGPALIGKKIVVNDVENRLFIDIKANDKSVFRHEIRREVKFEDLKPFTDGHIFADGASAEIPFAKGRYSWSLDSEYLVIVTEENQVKQRDPLPLTKVYIFEFPQSLGYQYATDSINEAIGKISATRLVKRHKQEYSSNITTAGPKSFT